MVVINMCYETFCVDVEVLEKLVSMGRALSDHVHGF